MVELITSDIRKLLGDKLYEKRKEAALDIQRIVHNLGRLALFLKNNFSNFQFIQIFIKNFIK